MLLHLNNDVGPHPATTNVHVQGLQALPRELNDNGMNILLGSVGIQIDFHDLVHHSSQMGDRM